MNLNFCYTGNPADKKEAADGVKDVWAAVNSIVSGKNVFLTTDADKHEHSQRVAKKLHFTRSLESNMVLESVLSNFMSL